MPQCEYFELVAYWMAWLCWDVEVWKMRSPSRNFGLSFWQECNPKTDVMAIKNKTVDFMFSDFDWVKRIVLSNRIEFMTFQ